jgi:hypothetical protein
MMRKLLLACLPLLLLAARANAQSSGTPVDVSITLVATVAQNINPNNLRYKAGMCQNNLTAPISLSFTSSTAISGAAGVYSVPVGGTFTFAAVQSTGPIYINGAAGGIIQCTIWQ